MDIVNIIITTGAVFTASAVIVTTITKALSKATQPLQEQIKEMDKRECRLHLIEYMADVEQGVEKDEVQKKFAHETFDHYTKDLNGNSYVLEKWNYLIARKH